MQLGKALGAHVTALAGARNLGWIVEMGADEALDYRTTRPEDLDRFDVALDVVDTRLGAYGARLIRMGRMVALAFDHGRPLASIERITELTRPAWTGSVRPAVDTVFSKSDIAEAHRRLEASGMRRKSLRDLPRFHGAFKIIPRAMPVTSTYTDQKRNRAPPSARGMDRRAVDR
ncbi:zinc-binding dehydrogenase [Streptomyces sp. S.PB5]|uniref:zinc-binding dehydrogenase n=1 Tax=Streptomyces sp. S.PB5 TaxID=3020844 RepID=UPI0025AF1E60|nr:zinc-binding dehydrogenase [Streptomyces sp. S.PB5]MDN3028946.1 zinc-binding dehydrogenase [Streptomyces sp. S.PB5]